MKELMPIRLTKPEHGWTCFHCGETFTTVGGARDHFGGSPDAEPGCMIRVQLGDERGLQMKLRQAEAELERYRAEDSDAAREFYRLRAEHTAAVRREEEAGYERGYRDERARCIEIAERVKNGLTNGGARNACAQIAREIGDG